MPFPFGGHPTLARFVERAKELGCEATLESRATGAGTAYSALVIRSENGATLTIPDPDFTEHLSPSVVTNYERRLGIDTGFSVLPNEPDDI